MRRRAIHRAHWIAASSLALFSLIIALTLAATNIVTEDTWVDIGSPSVPGDTTRLSICPVADYWIYLKFDLSAIQGTVTSAELRMTRFSGSRPEEISVYLVTDDSWSETNLHGQIPPAPTMPPNCDALCTGQVSGAYDSWSSTGLTAVVAQEALGDDILTLMIRENHHSLFDVRHYYSKEAPRPDSDKPQLIIAVDPESVDSNWLVADIAAGTKPSFDFDSWGRIHVMGMTEEPSGEVWYDVADAMFGPWSPTIISNGYFYGPGDLRVDHSDTAHIAWHNHDLQNPVHVEITSGGQMTGHNINTPGTHDGWDNGLTISDSGVLHQSSINPFDTPESLQYGSFTGAVWNYEVGVPGSGATMYGFNTSLAIDKDEEPHIAYCRTSDWTSPGELMYAHKQSGVWQVSCVVSGGIRGRFPSIQLDHWDRPHIAWLDIDSSNTSTGYVRYGVHNAGVWDIEDVDTLSDVKLGANDARKSVSLALNDNGTRSYVAYADQKILKYAEKPFGTWNITNVLENVNPVIKGSLVLRRDSTGRPGIVFWETNGGSVGLVRLARPRQSSFTIDAASIGMGQQHMVMDWSPGLDGYEYTVECRDLLITGNWYNATGFWPTSATIWTNQDISAPFRAYRIRATEKP